MEDTPWNWSFWEEDCKKQSGADLKGLKQPINTQSCTRQHTLQSNNKFLHFLGWYIPNLLKTNQGTLKIVSGSTWIHFCSKYLYFLHSPEGWSNIPDLKHFSHSYDLPRLIFRCELESAVGFLKSHLQDGALQCFTIQPTHTVDIFPSIVILVRQFFWPF